MSPAAALPSTIARRARRNRLVWVQLELFAPGPVIEPAHIRECDAARCESPTTAADAPYPRQNESMSSQCRVNNDSTRGFSTKKLRGFANGFTSDPSKQ